jgi:hypothetical protein
MVSSRDRNCQRRDDPKVIARTPPPAFLFPNQRCQRPEPACRPHRLAPGVGGGGYLVASVFRVNRLFRAFFSPPDGAGFKERPATAEAGSERKNHCGLPRGFPHRSVAIRLKVGRLCVDDEKIKGFLSRCDLRRAVPDRRAAYLWSAARPVNRPSEVSLPHRPKTLEAIELRRRRRGVAVIGMSLTGRLLPF